MKEFWFAMLAFLFICANAGIINGIRRAFHHSKTEKSISTVDEEMDDLGF
jgi:hypothetical protein